MSTVNYVNLANGTSGRKAHRKGTSTPGFDCNGIFVALGKISVWAIGREAFISRIGTQDRLAMRKVDQPATIAALLEAVRMGHSITAIANSLARMKA